ncbi:hypothetical protein [Maribellus sediminis]|uniref:hypothetical protein n=1 Tax=Maribellus sediminis TaxID=2696285 RepID=UPI0014305AB7|nr:hypothetical protein [Maribellus sediminis]
MTRPEKKTSKATRNYVFNLISFLPFLFLLTTGIIVLRYHSGFDKELPTFGFNGDQWLIVHQVTALVIIPMIFTHLLMHMHWVKQLFTFKLKGTNSGMNLTQLIVFLMCALTALLAWWVFDGTKLAEALREVHSKLGLLLIIFWGIHLYNYSRWLLNMTRKQLGKNKL